MDLGLPLTSCYGHTEGQTTVLSRTGHAASWRLERVIMSSEVAKKMTAKRDQVRCNSGVAPILKPTCLSTFRKLDVACCYSRMTCLCVPSSEKEMEVGAWVLPGAEQRRVAVCSGYQRIDPDPQRCSSTSCVQYQYIGYKLLFFTRSTCFRNRVAA